MKGLVLIATLLSSPGSVLLGALLTATITTASEVESDKDSGNVMLRYCNLPKEEMFANSGNVFLYGRCAGIVEAAGYIFKMLKLEQDRGDVKLDSFWCTDIPDGVTLQQITNVITNWATAHPEETHEPFLGIAMVAIHEAWPCKP